MGRAAGRYGAWWARLPGALALGALLGFGLPVLAEPLAITPPATRQEAVTNVALANPTLPAATASGPRQQAHYNVVVFGDSLGDGVWAGLYHVLHKDKRFTVIRKSRVATGLVRRDYFDWNEAVREAAADTSIDIAVIVMGTNDRQTIVQEGARHALFEPKWREIYDTRIDDFTQTLKEAGARIYWVGLPVMRSAGFERDMETFSGIFEARAEANGITFIPTHEVAADEDGKYQAYGLDGAGKKRLLRSEDGIHFTMAGYELLARKIGGVILADVDAGAVAAGAGADRALAAQPAAVKDGAAAGPSVAAIGLKRQVYDVADIRAGRSDDWRWKGADVK